MVLAAMLSKALSLKVEIEGCFFSFKYQYISIVIARNEAISAYANQLPLKLVGDMNATFGFPQACCSVNFLCGGCFVPRNDVLVMV